MKNTKSQSHIIAGEQFDFTRVKSPRGVGHHWRIIHARSGHDSTDNFKHDTLENALDDIAHVAKLRGDSWKSDNDSLVQVTCTPAVAAVKPVRGDLVNLPSVLECAADTLDGFGCENADYYRAEFAKIERSHAAILAALDDLRAPPLPAPVGKRGPRVIAADLENIIPKEIAP